MRKGKLSVSVLSRKWWFRILMVFYPSKYDIALPENWSEVDYYDKFEIIKVLLQAHTMTKEAARIAVLHVIMDLPDFIFYRIHSLYFAEDLIPHIEWIFEHKVKDRFAAHIVIETPWMVPAPEATDMTIKRYLDNERYFSEFMKEGAPTENIYMWMASFLVPSIRSYEKTLMETGLLPNTSNEERKLYAKRLEAARPEQMYYLFLYHVSQHTALKQKYPHFFEGDNETDKKTDWDMIPTAIAETGVFGSLEQVLRTPATSYLAWANAKAAAAAEAKQKELQDIIRNNHQKFIS